MSTELPPYPRAGQRLRPKGKWPAYAATGKRELKPMQALGFEKLCQSSPDIT